MADARGLWKRGVEMNEKNFTEAKKRARKFFLDLEKHLNRHLPSPTRIRERVAELKASADTGEGWKNNPESAFLNEYIYRRVHEFVADWDRMNDEMAREALLCE